MLKRLMTIGAVLMLAATAAFAQEGLVVSPGTPFLDITVGKLTAAEDYKTLGLPNTEGPVRVADVAGDLLVLEFFNRYCMSCMRQAPEMNAFFDMVKTSDLAGRVRVLGVGVGNTTKDLNAFKAEQKLSFPMAEDPQFAAYDRMDNSDGTPFTLILLKKEGKWVVADTHIGPQGQIELMAKTRVIVEGRQGQVPTVAKKGKRDTGRVELTDTQEREHAKAVLGKALGRAVEVRIAEGATERKIYEALDEAKKPLGLYAVISQRQPVCDLCHVVLFALAFDGDGVVRGFLPVYLTKFGNAAWDEKDIEHTTKRLVGRPTVDLTYQGEVDGVTSATMSSALIFDEARRAGEDVRKLKKR